MTFPVIAALTGGIIIIFQMLLTLYVVGGRIKYRVSIGDAGEVAMERRIRAHGNLAENAALILVGLALLELSGISSIVVQILGGWFVIARLAHALGMVEKKDRVLDLKSLNMAREFGAVSTVLIGMGIGGGLIYMTTLNI